MAKKDRKGENWKLDVMKISRKAEMTKKAQKELIKHQGDHSWNSLVQDMANKIKILQNKKKPNRRRMGTFSLREKN